MFSTGTHAKSWTYKNSSELAELRKTANADYISRFVEKNARETDFLTPKEEKILCKYFEFTLLEFCKKFKPPMPKNVISCSFHYYKRFYLHNSVMDYHPKHIIVTCVFLACKVEEFNVSIIQFVSNIKGDRAKAKEIVLSHELLLMQQLQYHLVIHHPYRPVEGFLIDVKTRCPSIQDAERLRPIVEDFLERIYFTDAYLLYAPSQIALAAISYAERKHKANMLDIYIAEVLFTDGPKEKLQHVNDAVKSIWQMVRNIEALPRDQIKVIEKKMESCRNEENNPSSTAYKRKLEEMREEEEMEQTRKYIRLSEKQKLEDQEVLGLVEIES